MLHKRLRKVSLRSRDEYREGSNRHTITLNLLQAQAQSTVPSSTAAGGDDIASSGEKSVSSHTVGSDSPLGLIYRPGSAPGHLDKPLQAESYIRLKGGGEARRQVADHDFGSAECYGVASIM